MSSEFSAGTSRERYANLYERVKEIINPFWEAYYNGELTLDELERLQDEALERALRKNDES